MSRPDTGTWGREETASATDSPDRAVTEVLGYALIFALVITTVGFITVLGLPELEEIQRTEQAANAERAFNVVGDNMAAVYERGAPSRSTEIDLGGSAIYYGSNVSMGVEIGGTEVANRSFRPVTLNVNDRTELIFSGGAIFRNQTDGGVILEQPPFVLKDDRVHVPIVQTTAPAIESAGGTTVLLRGESRARSVEALRRSGTSDVTITITNSPRYELWQRYFEETSAVDGCTVDAAAQSVECDINDVETVYVTRQRISLSLIL
jgi:hypothetical protein